MPNSLFLLAYERAPWLLPFLALLAKSDAPAWDADDEAELPCPRCGSPDSVTFHVADLEAPCNECQVVTACIPCRSVYEWTDKTGRYSKVLYAPVSPITINVDKKP